MDELESRRIWQAAFESGRQSALTVSPEKMEAVSKAILKERVRFGCGVTGRRGRPLAIDQILARAAAIALGLKVSE